MPPHRWFTTIAILTVALHGLEPANGRETSRPPLIGIDSVSSDKIIRAARDAGGIPVVLPPTDAGRGMVDTYLEKLDGLLLPGGADSPVAENGEEPHPSAKLLDDSDFTLVVLPDTQDYADRSVNHARNKWGKDCSGYFGIQTTWVKDNARRLNIRFLLHTGDITQMDQPAEWRIARQALTRLDDLVPYALAVGNHDMGCRLDGSTHGKTATSRHSRLDEFFPASSISDRPWFAGCLGDSLTNACYQFEQDDLKFLIVSLEFKPRDESLSWASGMVEKFPDHRVIVMTHGYMNPKARKNSYASLPYQVAGNDGEQVWKKFISRHRNIFLVLCGHTQGEGRRTDRGIHGNEVHQLLADYRHLENGGGSWLRYLVFRPTRNRIDVFTYNPALDRFMNGPESRFAIACPMN